jgi:hypothetical protein
MRVSFGLRGRMDFSDHSYQFRKRFRLLVSIARLRRTLLRSPRFRVEQQFVGSGFAQVSTVGQAAGPRFHC